MASFKTVVETETVIDAEGNEKTTKLEKSTSLERSGEPEYIKVYTNMWAEFNGVPTAYKDLFLQLAIRMTYCNLDDLKNAQLVNTGKPYSESIMNALGWKKDMLKKGLRELTKANAIEHVARGVYRINPNYAGKGEWKYNPRLKRGGIEDLIATFNFKDKTVKTEIVWTDDGEDSDINSIYRKGLNLSEGQEATLKVQTISGGESNAEDIPSAS